MSGLWTAVLVPVCAVVAFMLLVVGLLNEQAYTVAAALYFQAQIIVLLLLDPPARVRRTRL